MFAVNGQWHTPTTHHQHNTTTPSKNGRACMYCRQAAAPTVSIHTTGMFKVSARAREDQIELSRSLPLPSVSQSFSLARSRWRCVRLLATRSSLRERHTARPFSSRSLGRHHVEESDRTHTPQIGWSWFQAHSSECASPRKLCQSACNQTASEGQQRTRPYSRQG